MKYGLPPVEVGTFFVEPTEFLYCQYLPVRIPGQRWAVPDNVKWATPLLERISVSHDDYVYITVRNMFCTPDSANRPGWHSDGFGSDDENYIWCNASPTEFCVQSFDLTDDHAISLAEMEDQARSENIRTYPVNTLLRLDQYVIHRVAPNAAPGYRAFVKISVSKARYNLKGNAHNYLLNYEWEMHSRDATRNHPVVMP